MRNSIEKCFDSMESTFARVAVVRITVSACVRNGTSWVTRLSAHRAFSTWPLNRLRFIAYPFWSTKAMTAMTIEPGYLSEFKWWLGC